MTYNGLKRGATINRNYGYVFTRWIQIQIYWTTNGWKPL